MTPDDLRLDVVAPDDYVREVLPLTSALWAGARTFDEYAAEFRATAGSGWGKRRFRTVGLRIGGALVASCKRYERELRCGERTYRAAGIGAVFTPEELRGRGYATALIAAFLDAERNAGSDLAYLFSDLHPAFYARLGFVALPSRTIALRADTLPADRVEVAVLTGDDAAAVRRVFDALDAHRPFAFVRRPLDWEWQRMRAESGEHTAQLIRLGVRRGRSLGAYVAGRRIPAADAFVLEELAFAREDDARYVAPLLRAAAGDLRTIRGWLPPAVARDALPRGAVRPRGSAISMFIPLSARFRTAFRARETRRESADPCWNTDQI